MVSCLINLLNHYLFIYFTDSNAWQGIVKRLVLV